MQVTRRSVGIMSCSSLRLRDPEQVGARELVPAGFLFVDESVIGQLKTLEIDTKITRKLGDHIHGLLH